MTGQEIDRVINKVKNKIYSPIYFLTGDETYYIDYFTKYCDENILKDDQISFNKTILYGKETSVQEIISVCKRYPLNSEYQIVIIKEAQHLSKNLDSLSDYALNPLMSTILIINYKYKVLDKRKKLFKSVQKFGMIINCKKMYDNQISGWIKARLENENFVIDNKASFMLFEFLGNDLNKIVKNIEKLKIISEDKKITDYLIEKNIGFSKDYNVFELRNAIGDKNLEKALKICNYMSKNFNKHPIQVTISLVFNYFIQIFKLHSIENKSSSNISKIIGINPYFLDEYVKASRNYSLKNISKIISLVRDFDLKTKGYNGSNISNGDILKQMVVQIINN